MDDFASKDDLNGVGSRLNNVEIGFARFQGCVEKCMSTLQSDTQNQYEMIHELEAEVHNIELGVTKMRDDVIAKISVRMGLMIGVMTIIIAAIQVASILAK